MADLRVTGTPEHSRQVTQVSSEGSRDPSQNERQPQHRQRRSAPGAEELALALMDDGRTAIEAHYEQDEDGNALIRIVDRERGETVALVTPEELRAMAEQTGLPPGLLLHTAT